MIPIYSANEIKQWDAFSIQHEPIASIDLMERASQTFTQRFVAQFSTEQPVYVLAGKGNNGGDGLAIARMLRQHGFPVQVIMPSVHPLSHDCALNYQRWLALGGTVLQIDETNFQFPNIPAEAILIDALFGTGLSRLLTGWMAAIVAHINSLPNTVVAVDVPSGLWCDGLTEGGAVIEADYCFTFQCIKLAFMLPENAHYVGEWEVLDIGLHPGFVQQHPPKAGFVTHPLAVLQPIQYDRFAHKGTRGHALLGAGSAAMMGAAVMATHAALRSGAGLVTVATEASAWPLIQQTNPEAICAAKGALANESFQLQRRIKAIGVGSGWVADEEHIQLLAWLLENSTVPFLIDATALSLLVDMLPILELAALRIPIVLTPHVGEFDRLFGYSGNHALRLEKAIHMAKHYRLCIVLKGGYTRIVLPNGHVYFNSTGNHGMAKAGSGDVLAGLMTGLLAQGYAVQDAAILAVWLHGSAGDAAAKAMGTEAMTAMDIAQHLPQAWKQLEIVKG